MGYFQEYEQSISQPENFWAHKAESIQWFKPPVHILSKDDNGVQRWFADAEMNTAYLALDVQVENGRGEQTALIYDSPMGGEKRQYSYLQLRNEVAKFAGVLAGFGLVKGDTVVIYMPMIPEAVIAMLACARIGAVHSVVFGGFAPNELKVRIDDAKPKVIVSASAGLEGNKVLPYKPLLDEAIELAEHQPAHCIILQRPQVEAKLLDGRDVDWQQKMATAKAVDCTPVKGSDPLYILYTSGTTGKPKGIVRDNGGHAVALKYSMKAIYNMEPGDIFWAASDIGWVVGHSYIVYGPLLAGCTTVLYEGKPVRTPDAGAFWRVIEEYQVKALFVAPTAFRAIIKEDPQAKLLENHNIASLETIFLAGERLDPPTYDWLRGKLDRPVVDHWWQTETGWAIAANLTGIDTLPTKPGSASFPVPGYDLHIFDAAGNDQAPLEHGEIVIRLPLPPGCFPTIWNNHQRFEEAYFKTYPGYYLSGDEGYKDEDGYVFIMGRSDDVINVAGHRFSTGEMEELIASYPAVAECAVIGVNDQLRGEIPVAFALLKDDATITAEALERQLIELVREKTGAVAYLRQVLTVKRLPKTRSGKILRKTLRKIANGEEYSMPSTIDDPASLTELKALMQQRGVGVFKLPAT